MNTGMAGTNINVEQFRQRINTNPNEVADRLWVEDHLNPEKEKLRIPK
jgi:hypothetical protein